MYGELRTELASTVEYAEFHFALVTRAKGMCEREGCTATGRHVHHKKPVSRYPSKALEVDNGEYVCVECHQELHPEQDIAA